MKLHLFSVYDSKALAYMPPFNMGSRGAAIRAFEDTCDDPNHQFSRHPEDFTLFELATFDDADGTFNILSTPHPLAKAIEFAGNIPTPENNNVEKIAG